MHRRYHLRAQVRLQALQYVPPNVIGVYHWASVTGGRYGRICGWYAGWWNFFAWTVGVASLVSFMSLQLVAIYGTLHPSLQVQQWHIFCSYIACNWTCCLIVLFGNKLLPLIESTGTFLILAGFLITVIVCAIMPRTSGQGYASSRSVWADWQNNTGWSSDGFVFCLGMLNAAFAVCAPDIPSHLAEEMPKSVRHLFSSLLFSTSRANSCFPTHPAQDTTSPSRFSLSTSPRSSLASPT